MAGDIDKHQGIPQHQLDSLNEQQIKAAERRDVANDLKGRHEYKLVKKVVVHASHDGKDYDTVRIELLDGRVITVVGKWGRAEVTNSRLEGH